MSEEIERRWNIYNRGQEITPETTTISEPETDGDIEFRPYNGLDRHDFTSNSLSLTGLISRIILSGMVLQKVLLYHQQRPSKRRMSKRMRTQSCPAGLRPRWKKLGFDSTLVYGTVLPGDT
jgi:hypothetical protein